MKQKQRGSTVTDLQDPQVVAEMKRAVGGNDELPPADFQEPELALSDEARKASEEAAVTRLVRINELGTGVARAYRVESILQSHYEAERDPENRRGIAKAVQWRENTLSVMNNDDRREVERASTREAIPMIRELATITVDEALTGQAGRFYLFSPPEKYTRDGKEKWHGATHMLFEVYEHISPKSGETGLYVRPVWFLGGLKWQADELRKNHRFISIRNFQVSVEKGRSILGNVIKDEADLNGLRTMLRVMVRAILMAREAEAKVAEAKVAEAKADTEQSAEATTGRKSAKPKRSKTVKAAGSRGK